MVHEGSYSQECATISFFYQEPDSNEIEYQITAKNFYLSKQKKLYGYISFASNEIKMDFFRHLPIFPDLSYK
jgi:hypothetical protein